jgi:trans-aconitate methyltransferase
MCSDQAGERARHWDKVYEQEPTQVSWYQPEPTTSLGLIDELGVAPDSSVLDVGGGSSTLVDALLARGFRDLSVLDVSRTALEAARRRLGSAAERISWLHHDVLQWAPSQRYDLWHDRAVFHFLVEETEQQQYRRLLAHALSRSGAAIVATFAADGPAHCSGLPVARYKQDQLMTALGEGYERVASRREDHTTPAGVVQPFVWIAVRRTTAPAVAAGSGSGGGEGASS